MKLTHRRSSSPHKLVTVEGLSVVNVRGVSHEGQSGIIESVENSNEEEKERNKNSRRCLARRRPVISDLSNFEVVCFNEDSVTDQGLQKSNESEEHIRKSSTVRSIGKTTVEMELCAVNEVCSDGKTSGNLEVGKKASDSCTNCGINETAEQFDLDKDYLSTIAVIDTVPRHGRSDGTNVDHHLKHSIDIKKDELVPSVIPAKAKDPAIRELKVNKIEGLASTMDKMDIQSSKLIFTDNNLRNLQFNKDVSASNVDTTHLKLQGRCATVGKSNSKRRVDFGTTAVEKIISQQLRGRSSKKIPLSRSNCDGFSNSNRVLTQTGRFTLVRCDDEISFRLPSISVGARKKKLLSRKRRKLSVGDKQ